MKPPRRKIEDPMMVDAKASKTKERPFPTIIIRIARFLSLPVAVGSVKVLGYLNIWMLPQKLLLFSWRCLLLIFRFPV